MGLIKAMVEAVHGEDDRLAGLAFTRLIAPLSKTDATAYVLSTMGFGVDVDGTLRARLMINGEVMTAVSRTQITGDYRFLSLTRGVDETNAKAHAVGSIVYDVSGNSSALDLAKRGFFLNTAVGKDLDVVGRNLGVSKCPGLAQETWRRVIRASAYLPKQPIAAFEKLLEAYYGDTTSWEVYERPSRPNTIFVDVDPTLATSVRGRFLLNGGLARNTTGLTTVTTPYPIGHVLRVVVSNAYTRRGHRFGYTNYFSSFLGSTITLSPSPGAIGTEVLIDWRPANNRYHYLAPNTTDLDDNDRYPYLADPTATVRCLLDHVRAAGIIVVVRVRS